MGMRGPCPSRDTRAAPRVSAPAPHTQGTGRGEARPGRALETLPALGRARRNRNWARQSGACSQGAGPDGPDSEGLRRGPGQPRTQPLLQVPGMWVQPLLPLQRMPRCPLLRAGPLSLPWACAGRWCWSALIPQGWAAAATRPGRNWTRQHCPSTALGRISPCWPQPQGRLSPTALQGGSGGVWRCSLL